MVPLLLLALLLPPAPVAPDQAVFRDEDFGFELAIPDGMVQLTPEEMSALDGTPADTYRIVHRADDPDGKVSHTYVWTDSTAQERQIKVLLEDKGPPFTKPDRFKQAISQQMGITPDDKGSMDAQKRLSDVLAPCMCVEGTRTQKASGEERRSIVTYLPGQTRYAMFFLDAPAADWAKVRGEFLDALHGLHFDRPTPEPVQKPEAARTPGSLQRSAPTPEEPWDTLEVTGSLVVAALALMSLFLKGGRPATTH